MLEARLVHTLEAREDPQMVGVWGKPYSDCCDCLGVNTRGGVRSSGMPWKELKQPSALQTAPTQTKEDISKTGTVTGNRILTAANEGDVFSESC